MSAQQSETLTEFASPELDPQTDRQVVRRANQLCFRAEPHTEESPCAAHLNEARRQLFGLSG